MVGQTNLSPLLIEVRTILRRRVDKRVLAAGAKLAHFNYGDVWQNFPAKTNDALQPCMQRQR
jgi:hypothetical protein